MKLRNPFLINSAALLGAAVVDRLVDTLDVRMDFGPWGRHPTSPRDNRFIYVFWHETLLVPTIFRTRAAILISHHADGELIARCVRHLGFEVVRGSSSRGGAAAVLDLIRVSKRSHLCITPDGPRGPRRRAQPGAAFVASQTGLPIVPVGVGFANAWRASSWDKFAVPKPFSSARVVVGQPMSVPGGLDSQSIGAYVSLLQERLDSATAAAERWASGEPRRVPAPATIPLAKSA